MKHSTIILLTFITITASGQGLIGKYNAYYGHHLELRSDSTFRYIYRFDLSSSWNVGQWTVSNKTIYLKIENVYDTLTIENEPDSLVLSSDEESNRIDNLEFIGGQLSSGGQGRIPYRITDRLAIRGKKLYLVSKNGKVLRKKEPGIWDRKKKPTYYFKISEL